MSNCKPTDPSAVPADGTILVVDDSEADLMFAAQALRKAGYHVVHATNGWEALMRLDDVDLVFLDVNMPDLDGYAVCKAIRNHPRTEKLPVVMLSDPDAFFDQMRGRLVGATDHLVKPCTSEALVAMIQKHSKHC